MHICNDVDYFDTLNKGESLRNKTCMNIKIVGRTCSNVHSRMTKILPKVTHLLEYINNTIYLSECCIWVHILLAKEDSFFNSVKMRKIFIY